MPKRTAHPSVVIIGAGRVGTALAVRLHRSGYRIAAVISKRLTSARRLAALVRCSSYSTQYDILPARPELVLITVPDNAIAAVARRLAGVGRVEFSSACILHTSGARTSDELHVLATRRAATGSLHPIQTFPPARTPNESSAALDGISYGFEGVPRAARCARRIVRGLGGRLVRVPKEGKMLYHIACVIASNYAVTLVGLAEQAMRKGAPKGNVRDLEPLTRTSVRAAVEAGARGALTGPIARGDSATVRRHLAELRKRSPDLIDVYRVLGRAALKLATSNKGIPASELRRLNAVLGRSR